MSKNKRLETKWKSAMLELDDLFDHIEKRKKRSSTKRIQKDDLLVNFGEHGEMLFELNEIRQQSEKERGDKVNLKKYYAEKSGFELEKMQKKLNQKDAIIAHLEHTIIEMQNQQKSNEDAGEIGLMDGQILKNENQRLRDEIKEVQRYNSIIEDKYETYLETTKHKIAQFIKESAASTKKFKLEMQAKTEKIQCLEQKLFDIKTENVEGNHQKQMSEINNKPRESIQIKLMKYEKLIQVMTKDLRSADKMYKELKQKRQEEKAGENDRFQNDKNMEHPGLKELKESARKARDKEKTEIERYSKIIQQLYHPLSLDQTKRLQILRDEMKTSSSTRNIEKIHRNWNVMNGCIKYVLKKTEGEIS